MEPVEILLLTIAFLVGGACMWLFNKSIEETERRNRSKMSPVEEEQFEIEPTYALITDQNIDQVMDAAILHSAYPNEYPAVPAIETRKRSVQ